MAYKYKTNGTCSSHIEVEMEGNVLKECKFIGGYHGNLQGIAALTKGMTYEEIKERVGGIRCGFKNTSCPDQLVKAMEAAMQADK